MNEFYEIIKVTQYYKNNNKAPVELSIIYPLRKEINFRKFNIILLEKNQYRKYSPKKKPKKNNFLLLFLLLLFLQGLILGG